LGLGFQDSVKLEFLECFPDVAATDPKTFRQHPFRGQTHTWFQTTGGDQLPDLLDNQVGGLFDFDFLKEIQICYFGLA